jgi:hypothetical protein
MSFYWRESFSRGREEGTSPPPSRPQPTLQRRPSTRIPQSTRQRLQPYLQLTSISEQQLLILVIV